jgi:hypothetical protein
MVRTRLRCWASSAVFFAGLALARVSQATPPPEPQAPRLPPSAAGAHVKLVLPAVATHVAAPLRAPVKPKEVYAPLHMPKPRYEEVRIWGLTIPTFVAYGLSGVSAGGAVLTGYAARRGNDPSTCVDSRCTERGVRERMLGLTSGVLTGMAVAGLAVGVTFMIQSQGRSSRDVVKPRLDLGVSGERAMAKIGWVFSSF